MSLCQIDVTTSVFPSPCPDTPKYLEVQYHCLSDNGEISHEDDDRLPHISDNMTSVWGISDTSLDITRVQHMVDSALILRNG